MGIRRKNIYQAAAVLAVGAMLTAGAVWLPGNQDRNSAQTVQSNGLAGVTEAIGLMQTSAGSKSDRKLTSLTSVGESNAAAAETSETSPASDSVSDTASAAAVTAQYPEWASRLIANVDSSANVRDSASETGAIVGKMRKGDVAEVLGEENGWYQIRSGNLTGYISSSYALVGDAAKALADQVCPTTAAVTASAARVRENPDLNAGVVTTLYQNNEASVRTDAASVDGWTAVSVNGKNGYIKNDLISVQQKLGTGITNEEEAALIAAQKKAEEEAAAKKAAEEAAAKAKAEAKAAAQAKAQSSAVSQQASYAATADDVTILAAIIQHEAGSEIYQGQVAVGSVVMNRVRSSRYPNTVRGVIFQSGQFTSEAALSKVIARGLKQSCISAAQEALAGADVVGGRVSFRPVRSGREGLVIGNHVFF
ncbi:MAG: SH3 domain-containing protein [Lachnospiraceae bacterium]|nr:SH3 domain-containing protein [Lachnospiraceae bacterium]